MFSKSSQTTLINENCFLVSKVNTKLTSKKNKNFHYNYFVLTNQNHFKVNQTKPVILRKQSAWINEKSCSWLNPWNESLQSFSHNKIKQMFLIYEFIC